MNDKARILHIIDAIDYTDGFLKNKTVQDLEQDSMLRFAVERQLEIIGEASKHISQDLKNKYSNIEWVKIVAFRNFLAHEYFGIDLNLL